jgi:hypothetical protein
MMTEASKFPGFEENDDYFTPNGMNGASVAQARRKRGASVAQARRKRGAGALKRWGAAQASPDR